MATAAKQPPTMGRLIKTGALFGFGIALGFAIFDIANQAMKLVLFSMVGG